MTHKDTGNYSKKWGDAVLNETIAAKLKEKISENRISCTEAHSVATKLSIDPAEVGTAIDLLNVRIIKCQLGLFGYGKEKNIPSLSDKVNPDIEQAIRSALVNGRLPCLTAWEIAKRFSVAKPIISAVCEAMKIKISPCQLGAFR